MGRARARVPVYEGDAKPCLAYNNSFTIYIQDGKVHVYIYIYIYIYIYTKEDIHIHTWEERARERLCRRGRPEAVDRSYHYIYIYI